MMKKIISMLAAAGIATAVCAQNIVNEKEVDLGLSVNWAGWNIDAESAEQSGGYYAWGETAEKDDYTLDNYKFCEGSITTLTKYNFKEGYGVVDNKIDLDPEDDVAAVKWGDGWRMARTVELYELFDKCKWKPWSFKGVDGWVATGPNGKSIFFPYTGNKYNGRFALNGMYGLMSCGSLNEDHPYAAEGFYYLSQRLTKHIGLHRFYGRPVRAVRERR